MVSDDRHVVSDDREGQRANAMRDLNIRRLSGMIVLLHRGVLAGLCVLAFAAPVLTVTARGDSSAAQSGDRYPLSALVWLLEDGIAYRIGGAGVAESLDTHVWVTRIGLALLLVGLVAALTMLSAEPRGEGVGRFVIPGAMVVLTVSVVISSFSFWAFPEDRLVMGPAWGMVLPLLIAGWLHLGRVLAEELP